jgi:hypothetical protein
VVDVLLLPEGDRRKVMVRQGDGNTQDVVVAMAVYIHGKA